MGFDGGIWFWQAGAADHTPCVGSMILKFHHPGIKPFDIRIFQNKKIWELDFPSYLPYFVADMPKSPPSMEKKTKEKGKAYKINVDIKRNLVPLKGMRNSLLYLSGRIGVSLKINIFMNNLNVIMCERLFGWAAP